MSYVSDESTVRYIMKNEIRRDKEKSPPLANDEEFDDDNEADQVDGEFTPLARGIDTGFSVTRFNPDKSKDDDVLNSTDHNPDRRLVPSGFYPQWPTYYPDLTDPTNIPSLNIYQQKKNLAHSLLDIALLSANANQLRYVLDSSERNHYFYVSLSLISSSLVLQVLVAVALIFKSRYNVDNTEEYENADRINNFIMIGILLITITNVVSSAFAPGP